jgi:hypothetical protein
MMDSQRQIPTMPGSPAKVQVLGVVPTTSVETQLIRREGSSLLLQSPCHIGAGTAVRIDVNGGMVLGEVGGCDSNEAGQLLTISISHVIPSVSDLTKLMDRVMESRGPRVLQRA